jgi:hypothetical protein
MYKQIIEDFTTARYLFFISTTQEYKHINGITKYKYNLNLDKQIEDFE